MLTENQINLLPERIYQRLSNINTEYLKSIGRVIKKIGELRPSDVHKLQQMYNYGADIDEIVRDLAKASEKNVSEIYEMFDIVAKENYDYAKPFYKAKGIKHVPYEQNERLKTYVRSLAKQTVDEYINLTQHTAFAVFDKGGKSIAPLFETNKSKVGTSLSDTYTKLVDYAVTKVQLGESSYHSAICEVVDAFAKSGIRTVDYAAGYSRRLDTAVRQNILWGVKECNQNVADFVGEEFGADGYEISYHSHPRETHADMAGKQFAIGKARSVNGVYYPSFEEEAEPLLKEFGCLHFKFPILLGISRPAYSEEQLKEFKANDKKQFEFEGKLYTMYEGTQLQRQIETEIRHQKDRAILAKEAGEEIPQRRAQERINQLTNKYAELSKASGLPTKIERMQVKGFRSVKLPASHKMAKNNDDWSNALPIKHTKKEIDDVIEYAKMKNIKLTNPYQFDGDIVLLREQIDIIEQMSIEYKIPQKLKIRFSDMKEGDYAETNNDIITFNRVVLRNRDVTNSNLCRDNVLSSINTNGIAIHEMGHLISQKYAIKGIDIAKKAYYNVYNETVYTNQMLEYLEVNVSEYSIKAKEKKQHHEYKEVVPEVFAQEYTESNVFSKEFVRLVKELI